MSSRERWTIYPLLFLTLGIALKDKVTRVVSTGQVECRSLVVTDHLGRARTVLVANDQGGAIGTDQIECKQLVVIDGDGQRQVLIKADEHGGQVTSHGTRGGVNVSLGHFNQVSGLALTDADNNVLRLFVAPSDARVRMPPNAPAGAADVPPPDDATQENAPPATSTDSEPPSSDAEPPQP